MSRFLSVKDWAAWGNRFNNRIASYRVPVDPCGATIEGPDVIDCQKNITFEAKFHPQADYQILGWSFSLPPAQFNNWIFVNISGTGELATIRVIPVKYSTGFLMAAICMVYYIAGCYGPGPSGTYQVCKQIRANCNFRTLTDAGVKGTGITVDFPPRPNPDIIGPARPTVGFPPRPGPG